MQIIIEEVLLLINHIVLSCFCFFKIHNQTKRWVFLTCTKVPVESKKKKWMKRKLSLPHVYVMCENWGLLYVISWALVICLHASHAHPPCRSTPVVLRGRSCTEESACGVAHLIWRWQKQWKRNQIVKEHKILFKMLLKPQKLTYLVFLLR